MPSQVDALGIFGIAAVSRIDAMPAVVRDPCDNIKMVSGMGG